MSALGQKQIFAAHHHVHRTCPLPGVKQTSPFAACLLFWSLLGTVQSGHRRADFDLLYCMDMVIPLTLTFAAKPTCRPRKVSTTPFEFWSVAAFAPPATAIPAEATE